MRRILHFACYANGCVKAIATYLFTLLAPLGGLGLLILGTFDSSILFFPFGNDLLMVALTVRRPSHVVYYAVMAACGSVLGCWITDALARKGGEEGLAKTISPRRFEFVRKRVAKRAGWALGVASLIPPPFPFTLFVAAAAALQYSRRKLLAAVAVGRFVRFLILGLLAISMGRRILHLADSAMVQNLIGGLVVLSIAGSVISIFKWVKRSKRASGS